MVCPGGCRRSYLARLSGPSHHEASEEPTKLTKPQSGGYPRGDVRGSRTPPEARGAIGHAGPRREPRVEAEPHGGPPAVPGPHRFRPNPAELCEALEGALDDPGFRQARPFVPVHVPGRERAG